MLIIAIKLYIINAAPKNLNIKLGINNLPRIHKNPITIPETLSINPILYFLLLLLSSTDFKLTKLENIIYE